ncbi:MAG: PQQ-binding-like beta-propeller repeat protein [Microlunatus sp.]|nr:PQQ-binding-like beta-propeller repeat protein [Microlunatus sp.]
MAAAILVAAAVAAPTLSTAEAATSAQSPDNWTMGGQNYQNTRSNDTQTAVSPSNAGRLSQKWTSQTHGDVSATPAVTGGAVYFPDWGGYLNKVDAKTGAVIWQRKLSDYGYNDSPGLVSRTSPVVVGNVVYLGDQGGGTSTPQPGRVLAVDAKDGHLLVEHGDQPQQVLDHHPVADRSGRHDLRRLGVE